jgi:hypothetical protein
MVHVKDKFEYIKWVIRSRKSKKYRQRNEQKKKDNRTINDLINTSQKTKDYESQKISKILNFALITQINKYFQSRSILPRYNWNIVESGVKHHNPNRLTLNKRTCVDSSLENNNEMNI